MKRPRPPRLVLSSHGYVKVRVGIGHPLADSKGWAYEHLVVWMAAGRPMPRAHELLHHRNSDRADNRIGNLRKITRSKHSQLHARTAKRRADGTFAKMRRAA
jgi:hypothetical protein